MPPSVGIDPQTGAKRYRTTQAELDRLAGAADTATTAITCALRILGLLTLRADHAELTADDHAEMDDTVVTLSDGSSPS